MNIVILAAGPGKRMHSQTPKVLHRLGGRALLSHVFEAAKHLSPKVVCVVYGHGGESVRQTVGDNAAIWVLQEPQLGTGHAVMQAAPHLDDRWPTLVLYGDVPLIRAATLKRLIEAAGKGLGLLTATLDNPAGYGRVLRKGKKVVGIVEDKDASARQRALQEINTGIVVVPTKKLKSWLARLQNDNAQKEYYLTDIVGLATKERVPAATVTSFITQFAPTDTRSPSFTLPSKTQLTSIATSRPQARFPRTSQRDGSASATPCSMSASASLRW